MPIDSLSPKRKRRDRHFAESGTGIRKRSPLEQAIAERTDRRVRYDASMREQGFTRTTIWVREDCLAGVRELVRVLNDAEGDRVALVRDLIVQLGRGHD